MNIAWWKTRRSGVGEGWREQLIDPMLALAEVLEMAGGSTIDIRDIKEKYGVLCVYHSGPELFEKIVSILEIASEQCCEECGRWNGWLRDGDDGKWGVSHVTTNSGTTGWIKTLCVRCRNEQKDKL